MRNVLIIIFLYLDFHLFSQPLTHRGGAEMPAEILLATFSGFRQGDIIYSAYQVNGRVYASWSQPAAEKEFFIRAMADDGENPVKTGVDLVVKESPVYILYRENFFTMLKVERMPGDRYYSRARLTETEKLVHLNDNLYYSQCPKWPENVETTARNNPRRNSSEYFYTWLNFNEVLPKYYERLDFELVTGDGSLTPAKSLNYWRYQFKDEDFQRGYIVLKVIATPLKNCKSIENERVIRVNLDSRKNPDQIGN